MLSGHVFTKSKRFGVQFPIQEIFLFWNVTRSNYMCNEFQFNTFYSIYSSLHYNFFSSIGFTRADSCSRIVFLTVCLPDRQVIRSNHRSFWRSWLLISVQKYSWSSSFPFLRVHVNTFWVFSFNKSDHVNSFCLNILHIFLLLIETIIFSPVDIHAESRLKSISGTSKFDVLHILNAKLWDHMFTVF